MWLILDLCIDFIYCRYLFRMRWQWGGSKISLVMTLVENLWLGYFMNIFFGDFGG